MGIVCFDPQWAIHSEPKYGGVRRLGGRLVLCTLGQGEIWCALDEPTLDEEARLACMIEQSPLWRWDLKDHPRYKVPKKYSRNGYFSSSSPTAPVFDAVKHLHLAYVDLVISTTTLRKASAVNHQPHYVDLLNTLKGLNL
jgi:hypothetical protein